MAATIIRTLFFVLIAAAMAGPGAFTLWRAATGGEMARSVIERRPLQRVVDISLEGGMLNARDQLAEALVDQLVLRAELTRIWNRTLVFVFRNSTNERIVFGEEGFWFAVGTEDDRYALVECTSSDARAVTNAELQRAANSLAAIGAHLDQRGIEHIALFVPTSPHVFPDRLPRAWRRVCEPAGSPRVIERLLERIDDDQRDRVAYPIAFVRELGPDGITNRKAYHWHVYGAARLLDHVFEAAGDDGVFEPAFATNRSSRGQFDNARALGVTPYTYLEPNPQFEFAAHRPTDTADPLDEFMPRPGMVFRLRSSNRNGRRALLIADSFGWAARQYLAQRYEHVAYISTNSFRPRPGRLVDMIDAEHATDVIFVFAESKAWSPEALTSLLALADADQSAVERR